MANLKEKEIKMSILVSLLLHDHYVVESMRIKEPEWEFLKRACLVIYEPPDQTADNVEEQLARCILLGSWCDDGTPMSPALSYNLEEIATHIYDKMLTREQRDVCEIVSQWASIVRKPIPDMTDIIVHNGFSRREESMSLYIHMRARGHMHDCTFTVVDHDDPGVYDEYLRYSVVAIADPENYLSCRRTKAEAVDMANFLAKCFEGKVKK